MVFFSRDILCRSQVIPLIVIYLAVHFLVSQFKGTMYPLVARENTHCACVCVCMCARDKCVYMVIRLLWLPFTCFNMKPQFYVTVSFTLHNIRHRKLSKMAIMSLLHQ